MIEAESKTITILKKPMVDPVIECLTESLKDAETIIKDLNTEGISIYKDDVGQIGIALFTERMRGRE
jgi:hypothetical protein